MSERIKKSMPWAMFMILVALVIGISFFSWGSPKLPGAEAATTSTFTPQVTVGNSAPSISSVELAPSPIIINENGTTTATCTLVAVDQNGGNTITSSTATVYRSGVGNTCSSDNNNCYPNATLSATSSSGNTYYATWTVDVWFHSEPTDGSAPTYSGEWWECYVVLEDDQASSTSATNSAQTIELNTVAALTIVSGIDYGSLAPGATSSYSATSTATTSGNVALDVRLSGEDMTYGAENIPVAQQEYSLTSTFGYGSGTDLSGSLTELEIVLPKPDTSPSTSTDDIYWRIGIPGGQAPGTYNGTTTVAAKIDD